MIMIDRTLLLHALLRVPDPTSVIRFVDELVQEFNSLGGGVPEASIYRLDVNTAAADPGAGKLRLNNAAPGSVTAIYLSSSNQNGVDISAALKLLATGDRLIIQDADNSANAIRFTIPATLPVDHTGWWTVAVTHVAHQGALPSNNSRIAVIAYF